MNKKTLALKKEDFYYIYREWFDRGYLKEICSNQKYAVFNLCGVCYLYVPFRQRYSENYNKHYGYIFESSILEYVCRHGLIESYELRNSRCVEINHRLYVNMMHTKKEYDESGYDATHYDTDPDLEEMIIQKYKTE